MKIKEPFEKNKIWFTSDTHFGHTNIIDYLDRPFTDINTMNQIMVDNWNKLVKPDDIVFHLGDFAITNTKTVKHIINSLNGTIHLVKGNHEKTVFKPKHVREMFETVSDILEITVIDDELSLGFIPVVMCHYPMVSWNKKQHGSWHLYGHVHGRLDHYHPNAIDVGVDVREFCPMYYQEVKTLITKRNLNSESNR